MKLLDAKDAKVNFRAGPPCPWCDRRIVVIPCNLDDYEWDCRGCHYVFNVDDDGVRHGISRRKAIECALRDVEL